MAIVYWRISQEGFEVFPLNLRKSASTSPVEAELAAAFFRHSQQGHSSVVSHAMLGPAWC